MKFVIYGITGSAVAGEKCLKNYDSFDIWNKETHGYDWYGNNFHSEQEAIEFIEGHKNYFEYTMEAFIIARTL